MMRRIWIMTAVLLMMMAMSASAEPFVLDENAVLSKMNKSWLQGYEPTVEDDRVTICLPLTSETVNGKITATLVMDSAELSPIKTRNLSANFWKNEGKYEVVLQYRLIPDRFNGDYPGHVLIEAKDSEGNMVEQQYPITIRIRDGKKENALPRIHEVHADMKVGESGFVGGYITNSGLYSTMTNVRLTIEEKTGEILPEDSNVLFLPDLLPGESAAIHYPVTVDQKASVSMHTLKFHLEYETAGEKGEWTESFTLPVHQEMRLEQGGVQMASSVIQGDMATLTLPLMNMGRGELSNVMATLRLEGIVERQSVLVGTIAPGETKQAKISFTAGKDALGEITGEVSVTAEDAWGNVSGFSLPVSIVVEEPAPVVDTGAVVEMQIEEKIPHLKIILAGTCAVLLVLLILQGSLLRRKIHRLEEERL